MKTEKTQEIIIINNSSRAIAIKQNREEIYIEAGEFKTLKHIDIEIYDIPVIGE